MDRSERIGAYRVTEILAAGTTSYVVAAVCEGPGAFMQAVAMKTLRSGMARNPDRSRDFLLEARAAASVSHPHVAQVHGMIEERGRHFLIMELVRGWSLRALVATQALTRRFAPDEVAVALVRDAALGAHALHDAGIVHRNLAPDNLLVAATGHIKIIDFGAASQELSERVRTRPPTVVEAAYAAPETSLGVRAERPCDVYTLGAVLRELCQGELPDGLGAVISRALRYPAGERFATAGDLAQALDDVAAHHGWRTSPAAVAAYLGRTFATGAAAQALVRRPPSELGRTRVRLRRVGT